MAALPNGGVPVGEDRRAPGPTLGGLHQQSLDKYCDSVGNKCIEPLDPNNTCLYQQHVNLPRIFRELQQ